MQRIIDCIPDIGIITTKSIGTVPRPGYREPVMTLYAPGCYMNAVGLTNPGADIAAQQLSELELPEDRFLLTSIFAGTVAEFVEIAKKLAPFSDGLELNLSCPHAEGYGMDMGQDAELVRQIVSSVKAVVDIPVIPKLTPNVADIRPIALAAEAGGADAISAINTVGPAYYTIEGHPILSNTYGGMSGRGILPLGLKCIKQISEVTDLPLIACGGISSYQDIQAYKEAGADVFGIGSALTGLTTEEVKHFFDNLSVQTDLEEENNLPAKHWGSNRDGKVSMDYERFHLIKNQKLTNDISILTFDGKIDVKAGEFIFVWIPGVGEKPFSVLTDDPFTLVIIKQGLFSGHLIDLQEGAEVFTRGPYGIPVRPPADSKIVLVGGGTGLAAVYQIARDFADSNGPASVFLGARSRDRLYYLDECEQIANLIISTDDGSMGDKGLVTESLQKYLQTLDKQALSDLIFYNCGPEPMVLAAQEVQKRFVDATQIYSAIDYLTKCGVGICGACGSPDGRRLCVDGPFLALESSDNSTTTRE